jgi:hypothetical protein
MPKKIHRTRTPTPAGQQDTRGRKSLAAQGKEARSRKLVAAFTPTQFLQLEADADAEGITVAELVAMRATLYR